MATGDLTTLTNVKAWLMAQPLATTGDDVILTRMITAASRATLAYLQRPTLVSQEFTEYWTAPPRSLKQLKNFPVTTFTSLSIDGLTIPQSPLPQAGVAAVGPLAGYRFEPWDGTLPGRLQTVGLIGYEYSPYPQGNVAVYTAGYLADPETHTIPNTTPYTVATDQTWAADGGVVVNGVALTPVVGTPATGQYVAPTTAASYYTFNAAQAGLSAHITYSYTPMDVEQAVIEWVGTRFSYKSRIDQQSKSLSGQETTSFDLGAMNKSTKLMLAPYRRLVML